MIIVDTNVISETVKVASSANVMTWLHSRTKSVLDTTAILEAHFANRVLPSDTIAARALPAIALTQQRLGRPIAGPDFQIAATARSHGAPVAPRNIPRFEHCGISLINPWDA